MLLARGTVQDRPFGRTVGTIAGRGVTGQLTVEDGYAIALDRGRIVAAASPLVEDTAPAVALANDIVDVSQVAIVERWLAAVPHADALEVLATVALLTQAEVQALRRLVIAQRAARVIALERGDFVLTSTIALAVTPACEMHVGAIIHQAARRYIAGPRLRELVGQLGVRFELRAEAAAEIASYGVAPAILRSLAGGFGVEDLTRCEALAAVYALASCGVIFGQHARASTNSGLRIARGTPSPADKDRTPAIEPIEAAPPSPSAEEAFRRAQDALDEARVDDAVGELERATRLAPNEPRYFATLAWARFCRAPDKAAVADETRRMLGRAIACAESPILPRYYLDQVERILRRG